LLKKQKNLGKKKNVKEMKKKYNEKKHNKLVIEKIKENKRFDITEPIIIQPLIENLNEIQNLNIIINDNNKNIEKNEKIEINDKCNNNKTFLTQKNDVFLEKSENLNNLKCQNNKLKGLNILNKYINKNYIIKKIPVSTSLTINKPTIKRNKKDKFIDFWEHMINKSNYNINNVPDIFSYDDYEIYHKNLMNINKEYLINHFETKHLQINKFFIELKLDKIKNNTHLEKMKNKLLRNYYHFLKKYYEYGILNIIYKINFYKETYGYICTYI